MTFSERLKKEREKRGWSQAELAEKIHVSRQSVSKWETGKNYPSIEVIIQLMITASFPRLFESNHHYIWS